MNIIECLINRYHTMLIGPVLIPCHRFKFHFPSFNVEDKVKKISISQSEITNHSPVCRKGRNSKAGKILLGYETVDVKSTSTITDPEV